MSQKLVGMIEALYDELSRMTLPDKKFVDMMYRRGYGADFEIDVQDGEKVEELYVQYVDG